MIYKLKGRTALNIVIGLIASFACLTIVSAEEIYKTVGKDGVVFYSSVPPTSSAEAEVIEVAPAPSEQEILAAQEKLRESLAQNVEQQAEQSEQVEQAQAVDAKTAAKSRPPLLPSNPFIGLAPFL